MVIETDDLHLREDGTRFVEDITEYVPESESGIVADPPITGVITTGASEIEGSRQSHGIQATDCLAGAIAEDYKRGTNWLDYLLDRDVTERSANSPIKSETAVSSAATIASFVVILSAVTVWRNSALRRTESPH